MFTNQILMHIITKQDGSSVLHFFIIRICIRDIDSKLERTSISDMIYIYIYVEKLFTAINRHDIITRISL